MLTLVAAVGLVSTGQTEQVKVLPEIVIGAPPVNPQASAPSRPEIVIGGGAGNVPAKPEKCAETGSGKAIDCLNQKLRREVDRVNPVMNLPPIDARSPDIKTGVVNIPAVQQQYGRNFGVSVVPYRPPPPVFTTPGVRR
ncbi:hypothetical protein [Bradyrhizobium roseum]|uniref:hypothetical protein n=1 Tax=Bradyrhizobium roseum TaxID=3056648 RepID=UPI0026195E3E|nr:hypothetical protein [Bradyrhizobium roseus]WKA26118.1 hypothetical protein QUH67_21145 [Bradyrhizobium roseus]